MKNWPYTECCVSPAVKYIFMLWNPTMHVNPWNSVASCCNSVAHTFTFFGHFVLKSHGIGQVALATSGKTDQAKGRGRPRNGNIWNEDNAHGTKSHRHPDTASCAGCVCPSTLNGPCSLSPWHYPSCISLNSPFHCSVALEVKDIARCWS